MSDNEAARPEDVAPVPGIPVECFYVTSKRMAMSYLLKPVSDQIGRAFRAG